MSLNGLWAQRNAHQDRANDAERKGFPETARRAREEAERVEQRITRAEAEENQGGVWRNWLHP